MLRIEEKSAVQLCAETEVGRNEEGGTWHSMVSKTKQNDEVDTEGFRGKEGHWRCIKNPNGCCFWKLQFEYGPPQAQVLGHLVPGLKPNHRPLKQKKLPRLGIKNC